MEKIILETNNSLNGAVCAVRNLNVSIHCCIPECEGGYSEELEVPDTWDYTTTVKGRTRLVTSICPDCHKAGLTLNRGKKQVPAFPSMVHDILTQMVKQTQEEHKYAINPELEELHTLLIELSEASVSDIVSCLVPNSRNRTGELHNFALDMQNTLAGLIDIACKCNKGEK